MPNSPQAKWQVYQAWIIIQENTDLSSEEALGVALDVWRVIKSTRPVKGPQPWLNLPM